MIRVMYVCAGTLCSNEHVGECDVLDVSEFLVFKASRTYTECKMSIQDCRLAHISVAVNVSYYMIRRGREDTKTYAHSRS